MTGFLVRASTGESAHSAADQIAVAEGIEQKVEHIEGIDLLLRVDSAGEPRAVELVPRRQDPLLGRL